MYLLTAVTRADLPVLLKALEEIYHQWPLFATQLGVPQATIHNIEVQGRSKDLQMCLQGALEKWFGMDEIQHTWWHLCEAVETCDNIRLADSLRTKYRKTLNGERHPNSERPEYMCATCLLGYRPSFSTTIVPFQHRVMVKEGLA